jgi:membrane protein YdbS with pleckstrin-like domain
MPPTLKYLASGERLILEVHKHYAVLAGPLLVALAAIIGAGVLGFLLSPDSQSDVLDTILGAVSILAGLRFAFKLWEWADNRIVVTDQRVVEVSGVLTRRVASIPLVKITDMTYRRTVMGRILGYGDLILESAGQNQALSQIDHLPKPDAFYRTVTTLLAATGVIPPVVLPDDRDDADDTGPLPRVIV